MNKYKRNLLIVGWCFLIAALLAEIYEFIMSLGLFWTGNGKVQPYVFIPLMLSIFFMAISGIPNNIILDSRYGIKYFKPENYQIIPPKAGYFIEISVFVFAIMASWLFDLDFKTCLLTVVKCDLVLAAIYGLLLVAIKMAGFVSKTVYEIKLDLIKQRETEAHKIWDPIMLEAVNNGGIVNRSDVIKYCILRLPNEAAERNKKYEDFLKKDFFCKESLDALVKNGEITTMVRRVESSLTPITMYRTKISEMNSKISEEISLDDD